MPARVRTIFQGVRGTPYYSNLFCLGEGDTFAQAVADFFRAIQSDLATDMTWTVEPEIAHIDAVTGQITDVTTWAGDTASGQSAGEPLPWSAQGLLQFFTPDWVNGRQVRGRMYIPGVTENSSFNGTPDSAFRDDVQAAYDSNIMAVAVQDTNPHVVWSRTNGSTHLVSRGNVVNYWGIQRSRRD